MSPCLPSVFTSNLNYLALILDKLSHSNHTLNKSFIRLLYFHFTFYKTFTPKLPIRLKNSCQRSLQNPYISATCVHSTPQIRLPVILLLLIRGTCACYIFYAPYRPFLDTDNDTVICEQYAIHVAKLTVQYAPFSSHLWPLTPKYSSHHFVLKRFVLTSSLTDKTNTLNYYDISTIVQEHSVLKCVIKYVWVSGKGGSEDSSLLVCYTVSTGKRLPQFWRTVLSSSSSPSILRIPKKWKQYVANYSPNDTV